MPKFKKSAKASSKSNSAGAQKMSTNQIGLVVIVVCVLLAIFFAYQAFKTSNNSNSNSNAQASISNNDTGPAAGNPVASLSLNPSNGNASMGGDFKVQVWEDSKTDQVNAVQANLTYPADKFDFVKIDDSGSAFGVAAPSNGGNGTISIARGTIKPVTGKQLLATFVLKPTASSGTAYINFVKGSAVDRSTDNKNTLQNTYGGTYNLTQ